MSHARPRADRLLIKPTEGHQAGVAALTQTDHFQGTYTTAGP